VSLRNALAHLTALRVPPRTRTPLVHSLHYFPWVGAAHGSLNVLFFLAASRFVPTALATLFAVLVPALLAGFGPWRGVMEATRGLNTHPGHTFVPGFRPDLRGLSLIAGLIIIKWFSLMIMSPDWRVRAILIFPILGMCAHTGAFLHSARMFPARGPFLARRRVRASFLSIVLLFLAFLFPLRAALFMLALGAFSTWLILRVRHPRSAPAPGRYLTLQTAGLVTEVAETVVLVSLVVAGLLFFR
jgi:cobalamin synthase